jgi:cellulose synthase operon protein C
MRQHAMMPKGLTTLLVGICVAAVTGPHSCNAADDSLQLAQERYAQQDWPAALECFLDAAERSADETTRTSAHFYAAECALQLKDYSRAQAEYEQVLSSQAARDLHARASFRLAEALYLGEDMPRAQIGFQQFVEKYSRDELMGEAHNYLGEILLQSRRYDSALASFAYVIENCRGVQVDQARLGMARTLLASNQLEEVPIALGRLCQSEDANTAAEAQLILGRAKYEAGQFDQALATFRRVYQLNADMESINRARLAAGWALWKLSRLEDIVEETGSLAGDARLASEYHYLFGMAAYSAKNWDRAVNEMELAARERSVHRAAALFYAGESALLGGNSKRARAKFQELLDIDPASEWADDSMWSLARAAKAAKSQLEFDQSCEQLRSKYPASDYIAQIPLLDTDPGNPLRQCEPGLELFEEAIGLERDGQFDGAMAAYHEFLGQAIAGAFRGEALWRAARLHDRLNHHADARKLYRQLLKDSPSFDRAPEALRNLAWIEAAIGNQDSAAKLCQELLKKFPQSAQAVEASYWLAVAAADEKRSDKAQWQVDWLLERLNPASRSLSESEKQVYGQTLCLACQLFAAESKWQEIAELLCRHDKYTAGGTVFARLEFWRAEAALRLGKHTEARERFDDLVTETVGINESWVPMVTLRRAQLAARREEWQEVLKLVSQLDERYPEFELAYECDYLRGRALAGRGEMFAARNAYGHVLENDWAARTETAAMAQWMIGETHFHQRNYEQARIAYERVIERHDFPEWQARAALQAGKCAELGDRWDEATKYYADAAGRWSETRSGKELNARLKWVEEQVAQKPVTLRR